MTKRAIVDREVTERQVRAHQNRSAAQKARVAREHPSRTCNSCGAPTVGILCQTCLDQRYGGPLYRESGQDIIDLPEGI